MLLLDVLPRGSVRICNSGLLLTRNGRHDFLVVNHPAWLDGPILLPLDAASGLVALSGSVRGTHGHC